MSYRRRAAIRSARYHSRVSNFAATRAQERRSRLQEFAGLVERAKGYAGFGKGFGRTFIAVHHREHQRDLAAGIAHGLHSFQRRAAGRGDVFDDDDALALKALARCETFDRETCAMLLWLLADKESGDRVALDPRELRNRACKRHRAHFQSADIIKPVILQSFVGQLRKQRGSLGIEHGRLEIEIEVALAP